MHSETWLTGPRSPQVANDYSYSSSLQPCPVVLQSTASRTRIYRLPVVLLLVDLLIWALAALLMWAVLSWAGKPLFIPNLRILIIPCVASLFGAWMVGAYDQDSNFVSLRYAAESMIAGLAAMVIAPGLVALFGNYGGSYQPSRLLLFLTPGIFSILSLLGRRWLWRINGGNLVHHRIIVIGNPEEALALESALKLSDRTAAVTSLKAAEATKASLSALLCRDHSEARQQKTRDANTIVIAPTTSHDDLNHLRPFLVSLHTSTVPVYAWSAFWSLRVRMHDCSTDTAGWLFEKDYQFSRTSAYGHLKRLMDIMISLAALLISLPVLVLAAILVKLDSRGPVFFRQQRVGLRGAGFSILKFRTMTEGSEAAGTTTASNDVRITRVGKYLRQTRIDEIPQLWNVLIGDMSIVGPRPEWSVCVRNYEDKIPCYHLRHLVKPGITGWAQVNYPYGADVDDARKKLAFDLFYLSNASPTLDFCIILKTVYVLFGRVGGR